VARFLRTKDGKGGRGLRKNHRIDPSKGLAELGRRGQVLKRKRGVGCKNDGWRQSSHRENPPETPRAVKI